MNHSANANHVVDPVCGMTIDPAHAAGSSVYGGTTFHFCAAACKASFDAAPARYAGSLKEEAAASACCGGGRCATV